MPLVTCSRPATHRPERRLAGAGFTDEADRLAAPDGERHAAQGDDGAALADPERLVHVVDGGDRLFHHLDAGRADGDLADDRSLTRSRHVLFDLGDPHAPALTARRQRRQRRAGRTADVLRPLAARRERALAGDVVGPGDRPFDRLQLRLALSGRRLRQQQSERVGVGRRPLDVTGVARLEDRAGVQHVDAVAHREGDAQVVGDEDHAHPTGHLGAPQQVEDLGLGGDVERRRRFVGEEQLRVAGQRRGEGDPLAHPTGQLERVPIDDAGIVDAHLGQATDRRRPPGGSARCARRTGGAGLRRCASRSAAAGSAR